MAQLLSGKEVAEALTAIMKKDVEALKAKGITPTLGIIRVGEKGPDISYEKGATKRCEEVGAAVKNYVLPEDTTQEKLLEAIRQANDDPGVHGILLFRPLPKHIDDNAARAALLPKKDMDGITDGSMAGIYSGSGQGYAPCTAESVIKILEHYQIDPAGKRVVVVGRSTVIGKPVALLLLEKNGTVTICHSKTKDMPSIIREADIVVVAMGRAESVGKDSFREGQIVVDVGVNPKPDGSKGTCGDVKFAEVEPIVAAISPVPGGVGSVTNCMLINHLIRAAQR
ncbi:MAG: bifunctional 5,10-methylene-tetrahydrofolate dehydrogenase/5,10-methylene-tetrahydrofolate cyclohydrolase [Spirochaetaceae bacterium]|jgi:methylenetetrahydrofolate dehydrogenase (NADP+)/methenyltetrahydrofolate cyclohydrolase|nr:bifunctional 5,10-methylene-tetrahydrofolate dehydrogenase/5,10-methylene-tetrahydrofolate cyclohydrolase [Spirochaetaceae bacterium]